MIFILGLERSATTWVANIIDCHPRAEVYMEPLSRYTSRFKAWPNRLIEIDRTSQMAKLFLLEFTRLQQNKQLFFTRLFHQPWAWRADFRLGSAIRKRLQVGRVEDFMELNFHRQGGEHFFPKEKPSTIAIKELRLNFNAPLIKALDEEAVIFVVIRNMASTVRSILQQFEQGNLVELKQVLISEYGKVDYGTVCDFWWQSYQKLLEALDDLEMNYSIVNHTALLGRPEGTVEGLFQFTGWERPRQALRYLETSNKKGSGKHDTHRDRQALLQQIKKDQKQVYPHVQEQLKKIRAHPLLKKFAPV